MHDLTEVIAPSFDFIGRVYLFMETKVLITIMHENDISNLLKTVVLQSLCSAPTLSLLLFHALQMISVDSVRTKVQPAKFLCGNTVTDLEKWEDWNRLSVPKGRYRS